MTGKQLKYFKNKNILVTGGSGFIGHHLVKRLKDFSKKIVILSGKTDITNPKIWKKLLKNIDIVFHLAGQTSSKLSNQKPVLDASINLFPIINLIKTCQDKNVFPNIIFAGTVTQVGLTKKYPVNENFQDEPITVYDINKLAAEKYLQYYSKYLDGQAVTLRLSNVYGPGMTKKTKDRGVLNSFIRKALKGESLTIYGQGNFLRDYTYIDDVVEAFLLAGVKLKTLKGNYYVIGTGKGNTIKQMAKLIQDQVKEKTGRKVNLNYTSFPKDISPIEFRNFIADSTSFKKATGWKAKVLLTEGIRKTIDYYIKKY